MTTREIDETRAVANLPGLDIEIRHRRAPEENAELVSITMRATPSFDAFATALRGGPALPWLAMAPFGMTAVGGFNPFAPWLAMMQAWSSFLGGSPLPLLGAADAPPLPQSSTIDKPGRD
jgi:hypothetical protein